MNMFISDNINHKRYFIAKGFLEPVHLSEQERDILIENIQQTMKKCEEEIEI